MNAADATHDDSASADATPPQDGVDLLCDLLVGFIQSGARMADLIVVAAERAERRGEPPLSVKNLADAHDRAFRSARRACLLIQHLRAPAAPQRPASPPQPEIRASASPNVLRDLPRDTPRDHRDSPETPDTPDTPDSIADLLRRPVAEAIDTLDDELRGVFEELSKPIHGASFTPPNPTPPNPAPSGPTPHDHALHDVRPRPDD